MRAQKVASTMPHLESSNAVISEPVVDRHLRPMTRDDLPVVERMFFEIFRPRARSRGDFARYFERLFLDGPHVGGGLISTTANGEIASVISFIPIPMRSGDTRIEGRMACAFMSDNRSPKAAARIVMSLRARGQDFLFTDSASHNSADIWKAGGGQILPVQSLEWRCRFLPLTATAQRVRLPALFDPLTKLGDQIVAQLFARNRGLPAPSDSGLMVEDCTVERFASLVPGFLAHFRVRPDWSETELLWLLSMASENRELGQLRFFALVGPNGEASGCYAAYFGRRGRVQVLDILARPGAEAKAVAAVLAHIAAQGAVEARGAGQPHLLSALSPMRGMVFRHRAFTCIATRHADIRDAALRNDIYLGGFASESWSRLMTGFF